VLARDRRAFLKPMMVAAAALMAAAAVSPTSGGAASPRCEVTTAARVVAIGDVHGAAEPFMAILKASGLADDSGHWSGGTAHLVQLGDIVDRGPDSRKALDLLRRLAGEAERAGGAVHALLGNHEVARMLGDLRFTTPGEYAAFATSDSEAVRERFLKSMDSAQRESALKETPLGMLELRAAFGREGSYGKWLRTLPAVVKVNGVLFVHGGISPAVAALPCDQINATVRKELTDDIEKTRAAPLVSLTAREDGPFWYRGLAQLTATDGATLDGVLAGQQARAIVIAHTVTSDGRIRMQFDGKLFAIDTGMQPAYATGGRPSALEFAGGSVSAIYLDRRDQLLTGF
jgi:hypothetical protein